MQNQQLLNRRKGKKQTRKHEERIITRNSNLRWCSDVFEIPFCKGDVWLSALIAVKGNKFLLMLQAPEQSMMHFFL